MNEHNHPNDSDLGFKMSNDLASQLSRALDAKTELEIRVARLEAMIGREKAEHWNDDGMCDSCYRVWPCPTLLALSAERKSGE